MEKNRNEFLNEKYNVSVGADSQSKKVTYSYTFNKNLVRRFIVLPTKVGAGSSYYLDLAKKQIAEEKKNGKLVRYSKKYIRKLKDTPQRKALKGVLCTALIAGVAVGATFLTLKLLNNGQWHKISNNEAINIINNIAKTQGVTDFEEPASLLESEPNLFNTLKKSGKQYSSSIELEQQVDNEVINKDKITSKFSLDNDIYYECASNSSGKLVDRYIVYQPKYKSVNCYTRENEAPNPTFELSLVENAIDYEDATKKTEEFLYFNDFYGEDMNAIFSKLLFPTPSVMYGHINTPLIFSFAAVELNSAPTSLQKNAYYLSPFYMSYVLSEKSLKEASECIMEKLEGTETISNLEFLANEFETKGEDSLRLTTNFSFEASFGARQSNETFEFKSVVELINGVLLHYNAEFVINDTFSVKYDQDTKFEPIEEVPHEDWEPKK